MVDVKFVVGKGYGPCFVSLFRIFRRGNRERIAVATTINDDEFDRLVDERLACSSVARDVLASVLDLHRPGKLSADLRLHGLDDDVAQPYDGDVFLSAGCGNFDEVRARLVDWELDALDFVVVVRVGLELDGVSRSFLADKAAPLKSSPSFFCSASSSGFSVFSSGKYWRRRTVLTTLFMLRISPCSCQNSSLRTVFRASSTFSRLTTISAPTALRYRRFRSILAPLTAELESIATRESTICERAAFAWLRPWSGTSSCSRTRLHASAALSS